MLRHTAITVERIRNYIPHLQALIYPEVHSLATLEVSDVQERIPYQKALQLTYRPARTGEQFGPLWATYWFHLKAEIPAKWAGRRVDLLWNSRSEAMWWRDGKPVQGLNYDGLPSDWHQANRPDVTLTFNAQAGEVVEGYIEMACNMLFGYDSYQRRVYKTQFPTVLEQCEIALFDEEAWGLYFDYRVLASQLHGLYPQGMTPLVGRLIDTLNSFINQIDLADRSTWAAARAVLTEALEIKNSTTQLNVTAVGHAHIDTAWLWPLAETIRKCARSFATAITLMDQYPEYKFVCSQAQQYQWMKDLYPELYVRIKEKVANGQFIPVGGTWIEPDCNIPSGEALVRQFLYGQRFFQQEFDILCEEFWNPDVFGYSAALPGIMKGAGIHYFLTQKLSWNQFNKPLHHTFHWEGLDGTRVLTHFPPVDTYNADLEPSQLLFSSQNFKDHDRASETLVPYGFGDGGGGPTRQMLELLRREGDLEGLPRTESRTVREFFERCEADLQNVPVVVGELYFEMHRGTYTSQADNKRDNRFCELLLRETEMLAAIAVLSGTVYPAAEIERLWKLVLLNQFHDILPGSSITEVYQDSERHYAEVLELGRGLRNDAYSSVVPAGDGLVVFNSLAWPRYEVIEVPEGSSTAQTAYTGLPLAYVAAEGCSIGPIDLSAMPRNSDLAHIEHDEHGFVLENGLLRAVFTAEGRLTRLVDLYGYDLDESERDVLAPNARANNFQLFDDVPNNWEAWDVDVFHLEKSSELPAASSAEVLESGPLRVAIRFSYAFGSSTLEQVISLSAGARRLEFDTNVDWQERGKFLKVEFPVNVRAMTARYEVQFGYVERPTHFNTMFDIARFEVPGHRWADLSESGYGVSLLTDSKYGYAIHDGVMRLSLLRSTSHPDPLADRGQHHFRYAIYPHIGDIRSGSVVEEAYDFNVPLLVRNGQVKEIQTFFSLDSDHVVLDTVKKAEDGDDLIVRLYECYGARGRFRLTLPASITKASVCNLLEVESVSLAIEDHTVVVAIKPFEVISLRLGRS